MIISICCVEIILVYSDYLLGFLFIDEFAKRLLLLFKVGILFLVLDVFDFLFNIFLKLFCFLILGFFVNKFSFLFFIDVADFDFFDKTFLFLFIIVFILLLFVFFLLINFEVFFVELELKRLFFLLVFEFNILVGLEELEVVFFGVVIGLNKLLLDMIFFFFLLDEKKFLFFFFFK